MPYAIRLPDGTLIQNIPDEVTPEQAKQRIVAAGLVKPVAPEPSFTPPPPPPPEGGFFPSVKRGFLQTGMLLGDVLPAMVGKAVGAEDYAKKQWEEAAETQKRIEREVPAAVPSYKDISSFGDAWVYAKEAVGETVASIIPSLFTGGVAGILARPAIAAANTAAREAAEKTLLSAAMKMGPPTEVALESAKKAAVQAGIDAAKRTAFRYEVAGGFAGSALQNVPEVYQNIKEETGKEDIPAALVAGGFNAALDTVLPAQILKKIRGQGLSDTEVMAAWYKRGAKGLGKGFLIEGATEAAQEASSILAENFVAENSDVFNGKNLERVINAGIKGGLGGGVITAATDIAAGKAPPQEQSDRQRIEQLQREILGDIDVARAQQTLEEAENAKKAAEQAEEARKEAGRAPTVPEIITMARGESGYSALEAEKQRLLAQEKKTKEVKEAIEVIKELQGRLVIEDIGRRAPAVPAEMDDKTIRSLGFVKSDSPNSVYQQLLGKSTRDQDVVDFLRGYAETKAKPQTKDRINTFLGRVERAQIPLTAEEIAEGERRAGEAVTEPSGAGAPVAGEPGAGAPAPGVGVAQPSGVVPAVAPAGEPPAGEGAAPAPVAPPPVPAAPPAAPPPTAPPAEAPAVVTSTAAPAPKETVKPPKSPTERQERVAFGSAIGAAQNYPGSLAARVNRQTPASVEAGYFPGVAAALEKSKSPVVAEVAKRSRGLEVNIVIDENAAETYARQSPVMRQLSIDGANMHIQALNKIRELAPKVEALPDGAVLPYEITGDKINAIEDGKDAGTVSLEKLADMGTTMFAQFPSLKLNKKEDFKALQQAFENITTDVGEENLRMTSTGSAKVVGVVGAYDADTNTIRVPSYHAKNEGVLAHEIVHAQTLKSIANPNNRQKPVVANLNKLFQHVKNELEAKAKQDGTDVPYGVTSVQEFIAEGMSNPAFQFQLTKIEYKNKTAWDSFVEAIANLLGIKNDTAFTELLAIYSQLVPPSAAEVAPPLKKTVVKQPKAKKPQATVMGSPMLGLINRVGGLSPSLLQEFSFQAESPKRRDRKGRPLLLWRNPPTDKGTLFRFGGMEDYSEIARTLEEAGYLEPGTLAAGYKEAGERAKDLIKSALSREEILTVEEQTLADARRREEFDQEEQARIDEERQADYPELDAESAADAERDRLALIEELGFDPAEISNLNDDELPLDLAEATNDADLVSGMRELGFSDAQIQEVIDGREQEEAAGKAAEAKPKETAKAAQAGEVAPGDVKPSLPEVTQPKPIKLSKETQAKIDELSKLMQKMLGKMGLKNVALNIAQDLERNGEYANRLITLALDATSPVRDLRHESLHAMKELGFFSDAQWKTLTKMARDKWVDKYLKSRQSVYEGQPMSRYDAYMRLYNGNEDLIIEEAIADAFGDFDATKAPPGFQQAILFRMREFFRNLKTALGLANIDSAEDIFRRVEKGELKETAPAVEAPAKASLRDATKADLAKSLNDKRVSPRLPTAVKATENPMGAVRLQPDLDTFKRDNTVFRHNIAQMSKYPNFSNMKGSPDQRAEQMIEHMKDNLLWLFNQWDKNLRDRSKLWYVGGNRIAHRWADKYGIPAEQAAAIIAALSPQKDWFQNVSLAERTLDALVFNADTMWTPEMTRVFRERSWAGKFPLRKFQGKTLKDMYVPGDAKSLVNMAAWIRAWDEATNPQTARVITPEGNFSAEIASGKTGKPISMRAQSFAAMVKTLQMMQQTDLRVISDLIGKNHKVRSFYNNIIAPYAGDDVTIDTHAVAAALMRPLGSSDLEVYHNFGSAKPAKKDKEGNILVPASPGTKNSAITGLYGTYAMYAEAYRRAAKEANVLPREMQSITWEAIRGLFRPEQKQAKLKQQTNVLWNKASKGEISGKDAREQISEMVSGITDPAWAKSAAGANESRTDSSYADELPRVGISGGRPAEPASRARERVAGAVPEGRVRASLREAPNTPEFKRWFGDSKVVDENGQPLVVYHGTFNDFAKFSDRKLGENTDGNASSEAYAQTSRVGFWFNTRPTAGSVAGYTVDMPVYLSIQNPKREMSLDWLAQGLESTKGRAYRKQLIADGYDGIVLRDEEFGGESWIAFRPEQIKSATGNIGTFSPTNPDIRYSLRDKLGMYSELENKIAQLGPNTAPASNWKAMINAMTQKGVKPDEIEWSGVRDFLDLQTGKIAKDQILEYLKNGGVRVEETVLGTNPTLTDDEAEEIGNRFWPAIRNAGLNAAEIGEQMGLGTLDVGSLPEELQTDARTLQRDAISRSGVMVTKYGQYTLPGGENYREVLLKLPNKKADRLRELDLRYNAGERLTIEERQERHDLLRDESAKGAYHSNHWEQPNVIAHIRLNDRTDADGNKVLFVEEIQSDWGQEGKKKGFRDALIHKWETVRDGDKWYSVGADGHRTGPFDSQKVADYSTEALNSAYSGREIHGSAIPSAPFVTKTEGWLNLALKRVMVMAAEGGYDKVAFVNGEQSADRYDLSKQIRRVEFTRTSSGLGLAPSDLGPGILEAYDLSGKKVVSEYLTDPAKVEDYVGKEVAQRLLDQPGRATRSAGIGAHVRSLEGLNLKVGGEGMKTFYDKIVPIAVNKLLPKVGGGKVEVVDIGTSVGRRVQDTQNPDYKPLNQPGFSVTPEMKRTVETTGLPRFSLRDASWSDKRVNDLIDEYARLKNGEEQYTRAYAAFINPRDFVKATTFGTGHYLSIFEEAGPLREKDIRERVNPPFLVVDESGWKITEHEGRHRMAGLAAAGINRAPVLIQMQRKSGDSVQARTPIDSKQLIGQKFTSGNGQDVNISTLIPINWESRKQLKELFTAPSQVKYNLREAPRANLRDQVDLRILQRVDQTTVPREEKGFVARITEAISPKSFSRFRQQALNRYDGLARIDRMKVEQMGGVDLMADASAESAALLSDMGAGITASALGVHDRKGGAPVYKRTFVVEVNGRALAQNYQNKASAEAAAARVNGEVRERGFTTVSSFNDSVKGPVAIFAPLMAKYKDPEIFRLFQLYSGIKRGARFMYTLDAKGNPIEKLFTQDDITNVFPRLEQQFPEFKTVHADWIKYNDKLVDYMRDTGVISEQNAETFKMHGDYFPFYRQLDGDDDAVGPRIFQSIAAVKAPRKMKGSEIALGDFLENMVRNTQSAVQAGIKNVASRRAAQVGMDVGIVSEIPIGTTPDPVNSFYVLENGLKKYYDTSDHLFIESIKSLNLPDMPFIGMLSGPANLLRNLVTKDPGFILANLMRDSMSAWVTSGVKMTPLVDTMRNFGTALASRSPEYEALLNAGVIGGYDFAQNVTTSAKEFGASIRKAAGVPTVTEQIAKPVTSLWGALEKATTASDAATRMEVYKKTLAETGNEAEAIFRALEVMNFNRKGSSAIIRILTAAVPFLNARMQGLDILYRAAIAPSVRGTASEREQQIQKTFFVRGAMIMALSAMYWALTHDDEEYKKQEQETRDNYWLLPSLGIKIPIPFEVGVLFKVIPERILGYTMGSDTGKDFLDSMKRQLLNTLAFNPIPQTFIPVVETVTNFSFFTWRPIIPQGMENIAPEYQVGPGTSKLAEGIGKSLKLSPMKIDHLINGYTGTMGMYAVDLMDAIYNTMADSPKPSKRFEQMPVIKRFAVDPEARGTVTAYYDLKNAVDQVVRTENLLERTMDYENWGPYMQENMRLLASKDYVNDMEKTLKDLREMKTMIRVSNMSADDKRDRLKTIGQMENALTSNIQELKKTFR